MRDIGPADLLRQLLLAGAEFVATFQVTTSAGEASFSADGIPPDVRRAFPGDTLTLRFDAHGTRDAEVVERDGVAYVELWAAFYSTLGGERFLSIPVSQLVGIADIAPTPAPAAPVAPRAPTAARAQSGRPALALRPEEPPDEPDSGGDSNADEPEPSSVRESAKSRAERAGFRIIRGGAA